MANPLRKGSGFGFATLLSPPLIKRKYLRKYSWLPDVFRIHGSIITTIIGPVLTVTIFAAIIAYLWHIGKPVMLTNSVVPLLSVVVGLILVFRQVIHYLMMTLRLIVLFRNGTSYDRFWEGRKSFGTLTANVRNLTRSIWINVAAPPEGAPPPGIQGKIPLVDITPQHLTRRKVEACHLALSLVYAVKHYLREEDGLVHEDYTGVLPASVARYNDPEYPANLDASIMTYNATSDNLQGSREGSMNRSGRTSPGATKRVRPKRSKPKINASGSTTPLLGHSSVDIHTYVRHGSMPLPMVIAHDLSRAIFKFRRDGLLETMGPAGANAMSAMVSSMVNELTTMERIANTPIPKSYGIHLKQCVTLYVFALPFTLINDLGWAMVPVVTIVAFTLIGIEGIADEVEMPFGNTGSQDGSDLPLDVYCEDLREEVMYMIARLPEGGTGVHGYDDGEGDD